MTPADIKSPWRESWKSAPVVNAHLVDDPTIRQPGFTLQWSLLNRFNTSQGHWGPVERLGALQTLICAPVVRPKRCPTSSNRPVLVVVLEESPCPREVYESLTLSSDHKSYVLVLEPTTGPRTAAAPSL